MGDIGEAGEGKDTVMDWITSPHPPSSYVEALTSNVAVNRAFKEVNKVKWGPKGGALIQ